MRAAYRVTADRVRIREADTDRDRDRQRDRDRDGQRQREEQRKGAGAGTQTETETQPETETQTQTEREPGVPCELQHEACRRGDIGIDDHNVSAAAVFRPSARAERSESHRWLRAGDRCLENHSRQG